jgi:catechol 2,3-dioxygenase-like lactoylglutathione lyase family enzyme
MSSTEATSDGATAAPDRATIDLKLEVIVLPVADIDRSKAFYASMGWRLDADIASGDFRVVQFTPPGSPAAIILGRGFTSAPPGSIDTLLLVVEDVEAARADLAARGVAISEVFHGPGAGFLRANPAVRAPGRDPDGQSYNSFASFEDPDGNGWVLQEITTRLPGRVEAPDIDALAKLLLETAEHHDGFEKATPPHDWWDWYAPYLSAREQGSTSEEATAAADGYMKDVRGVVRR